MNVREFTTKDRMPKQIKNFKKYVNFFCWVKGTYIDVDKEALQGMDLFFSEELACASCGLAVAVQQIPVAVVKQYRPDGQSEVAYPEDRRRF